MSHIISVAISALFAVFCRQGGAKVPEVGPGWGWYSSAKKDGTKDTALWAKRQKEVVEVHLFSAMLSCSSWINASPPLIGTDTC